MPNYAIVEDDVIVNVIVAENEAVAKQVTGGTVIECVDGRPWIGWYLVDGEWRFPSPFPSWVWVDGDWQPPTPAPTPHYAWNEDELAWEPMAQPFDSFTWNDETGMWDAPVPMPDDAGEFETYLWSEELNGWVLVQDGPDV